MTDITGTIRIAQILTYVMRKYKYTYSYTIKENNKEKSFCRGKLPFCRRKLPFSWWKLRKAYFGLAFFWRRKLPFCRCKLRKNLFCVGIFLPRQNKSELQGLYKATLRNKMRSGTSLYALFLHNFYKYFSRYILLIN